MEIDLKFWPHLEGKTAPKPQKICDFSKLAWYSSENGNAWTKCLPHHFGGCFARFFESVLRLGRSKCLFLALENGHLCQFVVLAMFVQLLWSSFISVCGRGVEWLSRSWLLWPPWIPIVPHLCSITAVTAVHWGRRSLVLYKSPVLTFWSVAFQLLVCSNSSSGL